MECVAEPLDLLRLLRLLRTFLQKKRPRRERARKKEAREPAWTSRTESPFGSLLIGKNGVSYGVVVKGAASVAVELPPI